MRAFLRSVRITPQKARIVAGIVRGFSLEEALLSLSRMHKKSARVIERVLQSARANAIHNDKQNAASLYIKELLVHQGTAYRRGVPMARGRVRPIRKFVSHISVTLGVREQRDAEGVSKRSPKSSRKQFSAAPRTPRGAGESSASSVSS